MAYIGIMCTEADIDQRSGAGVDTNYTDTMKTAAVSCFESRINCMAGFNFSDVWATTLNADVKYILTNIVASWVAIQAICYNMDGYTSRIEAEDMINVLRDSALVDMAIVREQAKEDFINAA